MLLTVALQLVCYSLLLHFQVTKGAFFQPIGYTLPGGLQAVNGSSSTGGCQPESCVMMPFSGTAINGCDCPGSTPASGVLFDGIIPSINITQHRTWASELFVVNRTGQDSFVIGFEFSNTFLLRYVEIVYLDCSIWGTGLSAVNVYSSFVYPTFSSSASTNNIGMLSLVNDTNQNCTSLSTISIPLQPTTTTEFYFIEFTFGGSIVRPINWLHLAEVRLSDVALTTNTFTTTVESSTPTSTSESPTSETIVVYTSTITDDNTTTTASVNSTTAELEKYTSVSTSTDVLVPSTSTAAISIPVFVGTLVGVIALLILLSALAFIILSCAYLKKYKTKQNQAGEDNGYDYVIERGIGINEARNSIEMKMNEAYGTHGQADNQENTTESQAIETHYEEVH